MSPRRLLALFAKDVGRGPRSPVFLYALGMPILLAIVTKVVLLALFDPEPRLGLVDLGQSEITAAVEQLDGIALTRLQSPHTLRAMVESNDLDAGLVLAPGFDAAVRAGERPLLDLSISGESRVTHRIVLAITAVDQVRVVEGGQAPVEVRTHTVGKGTALPIEDLVVLGILLWPLLVCSTLVPGLMLVQEKEQRTLHAMLATPTTLPEVMLAKAALGFTAAMLMCLVTLAICDALPAQPAALLVGLAISIVICCEIGLVYGTIARDGKTVYNLAQTMNMVILAPLLFYFFPSWPLWIAKLFPTWWFIDPLYRIALQGASLSDVGGQLGVALLFAVVMAVPVVLLGRRMQGRLAVG